MLRESHFSIIAKSNQEDFVNPHSKPQKYPEIKMTTHKSFSFDFLLELPGNWIMGVNSLEVYKTVYHIKTMISLEI